MQREIAPPFRFVRVKALKCRIWLLPDIKAPRRVLIRGWPSNRQKIEEPSIAIVLVRFI